MASQGKKKENKDEVGVTLKRLAEELHSLRAEVDSLRSAADPAPSPAPAPAPAPAPTSAAAPVLDFTDLATLLAHVDDAAVARLGYALASQPKVALVRYLLTADDLSAAELGEKAGLTTGSLYHHLRELIHSGVVCPSGRNRYALTELGQRFALSVFPLAAGI